MVLCADIRVLSADLGRVMGFKERADEFFERNLCRIVGYADRSSVTGFARADLFVDGVRHRTVRVARLRVTDTGNGLESVLHSPETAAREDGLFRAFGCFFWHEFKRQGIDAMPRVSGGEAFVFEDMPQMGPTGGADDFRPVAVRIGMAEHGVGYGVIKGRPAASGVELVIRAVERCVATSAGIGSVGLMAPVVPAERRLRCVAGDDLFFVGSEGSHGAPLCYQHIWYKYDP